MNAGIIGASGYSGEELVRLLLRHPEVTLKAVTSRSLAGRPVAEALPRLREAAGNLHFEPSEPAEIADREDIDLWFLALPHGVALDYAPALVEAGRRVIDLSADFRLKTPETYKQYYGKDHPRPDLLESSPYVIPELQCGDDWKEAKLIAAPGCYPTSIQLPLIPLLRSGLLDGRGIVINSYSGVSGAGKKIAEDYLYCERNQSARAYGLPRHRHLSEIEEQLNAAANAIPTVCFTPHLLPAARGIHSTTTVPFSGDLGRVRACLEDAYTASPFVNLLPENLYPDTQHVAHTNRCDIAAFLDERSGHLVLLSVIDNLLKGASGQAVQIMNQIFGYTEEMGLL